ncbi:MAG TPA: hypothetical protein VMN39_02505 [Longimicrobiaceae bacterium]|nr:hypothetical protein [Longimicrobiaceae bacterium]
MAAENEEEKEDEEDGEDGKDGKGDKAAPNAVVLSAAKDLQFSGADEMQIPRCARDDWGALLLRTSWRSGG